MVVKGMGMDVHLAMIVVVVFRLPIAGDRSQVRDLPMHLRGKLRAKGLCRLSWRVIQGARPERKCVGCLSHANNRFLVRTID
jgi:hypothetical protein